MCFLQLFALRLLCCRCWSLFSLSLVAYRQLLGDNNRWSSILLIFVILGWISIICSSVLLFIQRDFRRLYILVFSVYLCILHLNLSAVFINRIWSNTISHLLLLILDFYLSISFAIRTRRAFWTHLSHFLFMTLYIIDYLSSHCYFSLHFLTSLFFFFTSLLCSSLLYSRFSLLYIPHYGNDNYI